MMSSLVYAELIKLRTIIGVKVLIGCAMALTAFGIVMTGTFVGDAAPTLNAEAQLRWFNLAGASAFALILGILIGTSDQRHGTIVPTLLAAPSRSRFVLAKAVATVVSALMLAVAVAVTTAIAVPGTLRVLDVAMGPAWFEIVGLWGLGALALTSSALIGLGLGLLVARQAAALIIGLVVTFVVTPLLTGLAPDVAQFLPGMLEFTLTDGGAGLAEVGMAASEFGRLTSGLLLAAWVAVLLGPASLRFTRADVAA